MKRYFEKNIAKIKNVPDEKVLVNADGHINYNIAYYSFPQVYYQQKAINLVGYFFKYVFIKTDFFDCYDKKYDYFHKPYKSFVWGGKKNFKLTDKKHF